MEDTNKLGKKLTVNYAVIQSIYIMFYCTIFSFSSVFLLSRGFTNSQVGLTFTLASTFSLLFQPIVAAFADKTQKLSLRNILAGMLAMVVIFSFLLLIIPEIVVPTIILYILMVTFFSTQISLLTTMSIEHINQGVPINFSLARGIGSFAYAILSFLLGYFVKEFGPGVIMMINIGLGLVGIGLVSTFRKAKKLIPSNEGEEIKALGLLEFGLKNKRFMAVVGSAAILFFSHTLINTFTIQIIQNVGGDSSNLGIAVGISGFLELPAMALFPLIYRKIRNAGLLMKLAGVFLVIKAVITLLAPSVGWIYAAQTLQFFSFAMFIPASVYYVNKVISEADKNKGQACMGMVIVISGIFASLLGGIMLDSNGGVSFMLTVGLIVSCVGLVMLVVIDKTHMSADMGSTRTQG